MLLEEMNYTSLPSLTCHQAGSEKEFILCCYDYATTLERKGAYCQFQIQSFTLSKFYVWIGHFDYKIKHEFLTWKTYILI